MSYSIDLHRKKIHLLFQMGTGDYETVENLFTDELSIPYVKLNEGLRIAVENGNIIVH